MSNVMSRPFEKKIKQKSLKNKMLKEKRWVLNNEQKF